MAWQSPSSGSEEASIRLAGAAGVRRLGANESTGAPACAAGARARVAPDKAAAEARRRHSAGGAGARDVMLSDHVVSSRSNP